MAENLKRHFSKDDIDRANICVEKGSTLRIIRETQMKSTVNCHLASLRSAVIRKKEMLVRRGEKETVVPCCWQCKLLQPLWGKGMEVPQKIKTRTTRNSTSVYLSKEYKKH